MTAPRGKRLAFLAGTVAVLALVVAVVAAKERLREVWYLRQLKSEEEGGRNHAAEQLGAMKSARAVPELMRLIRESDSFIGLASELSRSELSNPLVRALTQIDPAMVDRLSKEADQEFINAVKLLDP